MNELNNDYLWDDPVDPQEPVVEPEPYFDPTDDDIYGDPDEGHRHGNDPEPDPEPEPEPEPDNLPKDYLSRLLREKGIDKSKVRIQNDEGEIEEWNFDDLDDETKYGILSQTESPISDEEMNTINFLRKNKMNLKDFALYQKQQAVKEYLEQNQTPTYTVDKVTDDDLFRFELKDQMPDLTDEEIEDQLTRAKENESFFQKKVAALRAEYKELEDKQKADAEAEAAAESEAQFNQLAQSLVAAARSTDEMNGMTLDDEDKEEVLSFLLDRDANGQSEFYKLFENPEAMFKMAWFALKGEEAFNALTDYYKGEITKARRAAKPEPKPQTRIVRRPQRKSNDSDPYGLDSIFK